MKQSHIKVVAVLLPGVLACAGAARAAPPATQEINPVVTAFTRRVEIGSDDDALTKLLKERHNTAVRLLELRLDSYHRGVDDSQKVFDAVRLVADAKLELARDDKEREAALEQVVQALRFAELRLETQAKSGLVPAANVEQARLARQTAEIQLLKARRGAPGPATRP